MTKRLYFTCPIKALYMHKEFGVKFLTDIKIEANLRADNTVENMTPEITKIYVSSGSEYIFQKTTSDICGKVGNSCQIILRGDKQFFEPEVENDKIN